MDLRPGPLTLRTVLLSTPIWTTPSLAAYRPAALPSAVDR